MDTKGRKLFCYVAGIMAAMVLMGSAYATTAMASGIGLIDTADLLDVHAEASDSSEVVGQVMDEGHVAILSRAEGWVQIKAGEIIGWVPESNLIETEVSNEEAYEANQKVVAEFAEDVMEALEEQELDPEEIQAQEEEQSDEADDGTEDREEQPLNEDAEREADAAEDETEEEQEREILNAQELAAEQARVLAEAQKQAQEQAEAFAREQAKAAEEAQKLVQEQAKAIEEAQRLAEEQAKAAEAAQEKAAEEAQKQAKAEEEAQRLAEEQAKAAALAQKQAQEEAKAAELARKQEEQEAAGQEAFNAANVSAEELELLASIIYCEAKGEPYIGKVAVGNVVLNRVKSSKYPDTIKGVIYAKGQFSPVKNGSMAKALNNNSADASCYQAALEALAGADPVGDKTSFRRVNGRSGQVIGHHVFY